MPINNFTNPNGSPTKANMNSDMGAEDLGLENEFALGVQDMNAGDRNVNSSQGKVMNGASNEWSKDKTSACGTSACSTGSKMETGKVAQ